MPGTFAVSRPGAIWSGGGAAVGEARRHGCGTWRDASGLAASTAGALLAVLALALAPSAGAAGLGRAPRGDWDPTGAGTTTPAHHAMRTGARDRREARRGEEAALVGTGTIAGTVTDAATSKGVEGVEICAWSYEEEEEGEEAEGAGEYCGKSGAGGAYKLAKVPAGVYLIEFSTPFDSTANYVMQFYADASSYEDATRVVVQPGASFTANAAMVKGGRVSGLVTAAVGGAPIGGIEVCAWRIAGESFGCGETNAAGEYLVTGLAPGDYRVGFRSPPQSHLRYLTQYYDGKTSFAAGNEIVVATEATTEPIDAALQEGGGIAGTVRIAATGEPDPEAEVCALETDGELAGECAPTGPNGTYEIAPLPEGSYLVEFFDPRFEPELYDGATSLETATRVAVHTGSATGGIDGTLRPLAVPPALEDEIFPVISGVIGVGSTVSCSQGAWTGTAPITFSYQWLRERVPIPGATGTSYTVQSADVGHFLACMVTATNQAGSSWARSIGYRVPAPAPVPAPPAQTAPTPPVGIGAVLPAKIVVPSLALLGRVSVTAARAQARARCSLGTCHGTMRLLGQVTRHVRAHGRTVTRRVTIVLGTGTFALAEGATAKIAIHLTVAGRRMLAGAARHPRAERLEVVLGAKASVRAVVVG